MSWFRGLLVRIKSWERKGIIYNSLIYSFLILVFILSLSPSVEDKLKPITTNIIYKANIEYLKISSDRSIIALGTIAILKGVVAIGNIVPVVSGFIMPVQDFLNIAWKVIIYSTISLQIFYYFTVLFHSIEFILLSIFIFVLLLQRLSISLSPYTWISSFLKSLSRFSLLIVLFSWIIFPLSIQGSKLLSDFTTKTLRKNANYELTKIKKDLTTLDLKDSKHLKDSKQKKSIQKDTPKDVSPKLNSNPKEESITNSISSFIARSLKTIKDSVVTTGSDIKRALSIKADRFIEYLKLYSTKIKKYSIIIIASYILDCLVFPFLIILLFIWFLKMLKQQFLSIENEKTMKHLLKSLNKE